MKLPDLLADAGRPVAYYPRLRLLTGSTNATLLLCQLIYWHGKQRDKDGWIQKRSTTVADDPEGRLEASNQSIEYETGLSYKEQKSARRQLRSRGLLQERHNRLAHEISFRINFEALEVAWCGFGERQSTDGTFGKYRWDFGDVPAGLSFKGTYTDYTETTAESPAASLAQETREDLRTGGAGDTIPSTPVEAMQHPDIRLFQQVCNRLPGARDYRLVIETMHHFREQKGDQTVEYLRPFWLAWSGRRRKADGRPYDPRSLTWFAEWAVNGSIPVETGAEHEEDRQEGRNKRALSEADLAAAQRINLRHRRAELSALSRGGISAEGGAPGAS